MHWIQQLTDLIPEMREIPLLGNAPPYRWDELSSLLSSGLEVEGLTLSLREQGWRKESSLKTGLGKTPFVTSVLLSPLDAPLHFSMSRSDLNKLLSWTTRDLAPKGLLSESLKEGFTRFLLLEILEAATKISPLEQFTVELEDRNELPDERSFCIDVELTHGESVCWGRLILSASFLKKWVEHFAVFQREYTNLPVAKAIELVLGVHIGSLSLSLQEWKEIELGDFLLLDRGGYQTNLATLTFESTPLFQVKIKKNQLELFDFVMTQEETMEKIDQAEEALPPEEESNLSIQDVPLTLSVELARLKITLDRLMQLHPGNLLDLPIHPNQSVSLTINGKRVGKGELVQVGETLGVRILELGLHK